MIPDARTRFNDNFTKEKYDHVMQDLLKYFGVLPGFRIAETPVFLPRYFKNRLIDASKDILKKMLQDDVQQHTFQSVPNNWKIQAKSNHPEFVVADFAITLDQNGYLHPMLIELQGFPSVNFFQFELDKVFRTNYIISVTFNPYFTILDGEKFFALLRRIILQDFRPEEVVLLELEPLKQTTYVDFVGAELILGIKSVCVSEIIKEGNQLFYILNGQKQLIKRIFNRVISEDWAMRPELKASFSVSDDLDVSWAGNPEWFFKISKNSMPFIKSAYMPETKLLSDYSEFPKDLENYVLKPLFSFSGSGVVFNVSLQDIENINDKESYILQKKVKYYPGLKSPSEPVKCEVRVMMLWPEDEPEPIFTTNLTRLSKGDMIGVKFNKDKDWVGGSLSYFET